MKRKKLTLVVLIPCYNEEKTLPQVIRAIPKHIPNIGKIMILVVNDGSTDKSEAVARKLKAKVVSHNTNRGLGVAFRIGIDRALTLGADIIVNIDADMQFNPKEIPLLLAPIIKHQADMVTGSRFLSRDLIPKNMPKARIWGNRAFTTLVNLLTRSRFTDTRFPHH